MPGGRVRGDFQSAAMHMTAQEGNAMLWNPNTNCLPGSTRATHSGSSSAHGAVHTVSYKPQHFHKEASEAGEPGPCVCVSVRG
mmetsp:Transcript_37020/g.104525  ORF Transcript_37020/g.104525 Transcript_37020/m.104525 type:complete len:83 (+) Transcript_37020:579-827(+)